MFRFDKMEKAMGRAPGAQRVGTRGPYPYFKNVEYGNGFVWQEEFSVKVGLI
jgi:hypothetical protein